MIGMRLGSLIFAGIFLFSLTFATLFCPVSPPPAPVVDQCSVELDCTLLKWTGGRNPVCVGPRSKRCDR